MKVFLLFLTCFCVGNFSAQIILEGFVSGISNPTEIVKSPTSDNRLFIVQQSGIIKIVNPDKTIESNNFLDISSLTLFNGERGLLGLAFHPQFSTNHYFFVYYNDLSGNIQLSRFTASSANPNVADPNSEKKLLNITKPFSNHNGGSIRFGTDGYLRISTGDGGSGGDPNNNAQNKNSLLGKILRIDINSENAYNIPSDNPFVGIDGADEIWAYGLRNAWKFSFDEMTNQVMIADVGQGEIEEINRVSATLSGLNFGWRCYEGNNPYNTSGCADSSAMIFPIAEYDHSGGKCSITGGYVYRGSLYPDLYGRYLFADYCSTQIGILNNDNSIVWTNAFSGNNFTTFGEDNQKELYIASANGNIYKIKSSNMAVTDTSKSKISIYPNPAKNRIFINQNESGNYELEIFDMSGKLIRSGIYKNNGFDISNIRKGNYIISLKKDKELLITQKIIFE